MKDFAVAYLNVLIDDADREELIASLARIARVTGGPRLVEKVELNASSLYRALSPRGNPELQSVVTLLKALGIRISLQPLSEVLPVRHSSAEDPADAYDDPLEVTVGMELAEPQQT